MSVTFGQGELGQIIAGSRRYQLTWDDLLWAARMIVGEAGREAAGVHGAAVLWSMASRMIARNVSTYIGLIQRYSQPINPRWAADGEFCRPGGRYHDRDECNPRRLEVRRRLQSTPWEEIPSNVQDMVFRWARGEVANPIPRSPHFAVPRVVARANGGYVRREGPDNGWDFVWDSTGRTTVDPNAGRGNLFVSTNQTRAWPDRYVKIQFERNLATDGTVETVAEGEQSGPLAPAENRQNHNPSK